MSKGLDAFNRLIKFLNSQVWEEDLPDTYNQDYFRIEKELKALEIIKNKCVNVQWLEICIAEYKENALGNYNGNRSLFVLTQQEFDLLKEVLEK